MQPKHFVGAGGVGGGGGGASQMLDFKYMFAGMYHCSVCLLIALIYVKCSQKYVYACMCVCICTFLMFKAHV